MPHPAETLPGCAFPVWMRINIAPPVGADARIGPATPPRRKHLRGVEDAAPYGVANMVATPQGW